MGVDFVGVDVMGMDQYGIYRSDDVLEKSKLVVNATLCWA